MFDKNYYEDKLKTLAERARKMQVQYITDSLSLGVRFQEQDAVIGKEIQEIQKILKENEVKILDSKGDKIKEKK